MAIYTETYPSEGWTTDTAPKITKQPAVFDEYGSLDKAIECLLERVVALTHRLEPVLIEASTKGEDSGVPEQAVGPLAARLRSDRKRINNIEGLINDLLNRLEI